jgi:cystathionine beta-synthase
MARDYPLLLDLVGGTPIVRLEKLGRDVEPTLLAKLEHLNPGGSVKDRIGLPMIGAARSSSRPPATPASASRSPRRSRATAASS